MKNSRWMRALRRKTFWFSLLIMLTFGFIAVLAPWLAPHDPYRMEIGKSNLPPMWVRNMSPAGNAEFPLGTDRYGRDILSRQIYGARTAFFLALTAVPLAALIGTLVGLIAGYTGGRLDTATLHFTDTLQSLPLIMFVVIVVLIFRSRFSPTWLNGLLTLIIGFVAVSWVSLARLVRINVLMIKSQLFVEAAVSIGASSWRILTRHMLPNVTHVTMVWIITTIPVIILLEAILGYIGVGLTSAVDGSEFTVVSWGGIFYSGRFALSRNPMMLVVPSVCILLISMSFLLLGDYLSETARPGEAVQEGVKAAPYKAFEAAAVAAVDHPQDEKIFPTAVEVKAGASDAEMEAAFAWLASLAERQGADDAQTYTIEPTQALPESYVQNPLTGAEGEVLMQARSELDRANPQGALKKYQELILTEKLLPQVINDLQDALYRCPEDISLWIALGDAQMRSGQTQDALESYTKAEELLR